MNSICVVQIFLVFCLSHHVFPYRLSVHLFFLSYISSFFGKLWSSSRKQGVSDELGATPTRQICVSSWRFVPPRLISTIGRPSRRAEVKVPLERIFGLGTGPKADVLAQLAAKHRWSLSRCAVVLGCGVCVVFTSNRFFYPTTAVHFSVRPDAIP